MARLTTMPAPAEMPCSARNTQRCSIRVAKTQPADANAKSASETSSTRRRPSASAIAPCQSDMRANGSMYAVSVCCTSSGVALRLAPMSWNDGR